MEGRGERSISSDEPIRGSVQLFSSSFIASIFPRQKEINRYEKTKAMLCPGTDCLALVIRQSSGTKPDSQKRHWRFCNCYRLCCQPPGALYRAVGDADPP